MATKYQIIQPMGPDHRPINRLISVLARRLFNRIFLLLFVLSVFQTEKSLRRPGGRDACLSVRLSVCVCVYQFLPRPIPLLPDHSRTSKLYHHNQFSILLRTWPWKKPLRHPNLFKTRKTLEVSYCQDYKILAPPRLWNKSKWRVINTSHQKDVTRKEIWRDLTTSPCFIFIMPNDELLSLAFLVCWFIPKPFFVKDNSKNEDFRYCPLKILKIWNTSTTLNQPQVIIDIAAKFN